MRHYSHPLGLRSTRGILLIACAAALAVAVTIALLQPAHAGVTPPPVPEKIKVPEGNELFFVGHAIGTQNYICLPSASSPSGVAYRLFTPQATLFKVSDDQDKQLTTHFFSPNPDEGGVVRAAWQHSRDTSTVWGRAFPDHSVIVTPDAIPWLLVTVVGAESGPAGDTLTPTTFIQRLNTTGGVAPTTGCASSADVGNQAFVPYTADYFFYRAAGSE